MKCKSGIYGILNEITWKIYVGSAVDIERRFINHKSLLKKNKHHSKHLQNSWNKYGEDAFIFTMIETVENKEDLIKCEQFWMDILHASNADEGYNICPTAGSRFGFRHSEETREKMSKNHSKPNLGKHLSEETKQKLRNINLGKRASLKAREKMSEKGKGKRKPIDFNKGESNGRAKLTEIDIIEIKNKILEGKNLNEIAIEYNIGKTQVSRIKYGEQWSWVTIDNEEALQSKRKSRRKLTEQEILQMKIKLSNGAKNKDIVLEFEVGSSFVTRLKNNKIYSEIRIPEEVAV